MTNTKMARYNAITREIHTLYQEQLELQKEMNKVQNSKYAGLYYRNYVDSNPRYIEFIHIVRIDCYGSLFGDVIKIFRDGLDSDPITHIEFHKDTLVEYHEYYMVSDSYEFNTQKEKIRELEKLI